MFKVNCIKDVVMDNSKRIAFIANKEYEVMENGVYYISQNEQNEKHCIGFVGDTDNFFRDHFRRIFA